MYRHQPRLPTTVRANWLYVQVTTRRKTALQSGKILSQSHGRGDERFYPALLTTGI